MRVLMVKRAECFSPNMVEKDAAILQAVASHLEQRGDDVVFCPEDSLTESLPFSFDKVYHMARNTRALEVLSLAESEGIPVVNSAKALLQLNRKRLLTLAAENGVSVPPFAIGERGIVPFPLWWKRDDQVSQEQEDVVLVHNPEEWEKVQARGIDDYVVEQHLEGDLIKFYSVRGTEFLHWQYPTFSKWGKEEANGGVSHYSFDAAELKAMADNLASFADLIVFGGDAIVTPDHNIHIIDFNDWPSFSSCRDEAAKYIINGR